MYIRYNYEGYTYKHLREWMHLHLRIKQAMQWSN